MPHRAHLDQLFEAIDDGYCLCEMVRDADGRALDYRFLETNPLFETMTGLSTARGRTARELVPGLEQSWVDTYDSVARGTALRFQQESAAMGRVFDVFATPVEPEGRFALVFRDITQRHRVETEREEARARAESLLAELNHRVMNTLAMITAIVRMEAQTLESEEATAALRGLETRLAAVTALYRALHLASDLTHVAADRYLPQVAEAVMSSLSDNGRIALECDCAPECLPTAQAAPLGLLLNEVMTNALKYAFPGEREGRIEVKLHRLDGARVALTVADDGIGTEAAAARQLPGSSTGIGTNLMEAFVSQLDGTIETESSDRGTTVTIAFPLGGAPGGC